MDVNRKPIGPLSSETEEALIEVAKWQGDDYAALIEKAVLDLRAKVADPARAVTVTVHLGDDLEALAVPGSWDAPRMWFTDQRVHVELRCVGDDPTEKEVAAVERLGTAVNEAVELFRKAYRSSGGR